RGRDRAARRRLNPSWGATLPCCARRNIIAFLRHADGAGSLEQSAIFVLFLCGLAACRPAAPPFRITKRGAKAGKPLTGGHRGFTTSTFGASCPRGSDRGGTMFRWLGCLALAVLLGAAHSALAQESASSGIVGQVLDSTRGALPGASVTVINTGTNAQRTAVTDGDGRFSIPNLPPAVYRIHVELSGFQTVELKDVR